jgi:hypothetical protein
MDIKKFVKNNKLVAFIVAAVIIYLFYVTIQPDKNDKGVKLKVFGWKDGVKVGELQVVSNGQLFSTVEFGVPGTVRQDLDAISVQHTLISDPTTDVSIDINDVVASFATDNLNGDLPFNGDTRYDDALTSAAVPRQLVLPVGESLGPYESSPFSIDDLTDDCNDAPFCVFKLQLDASFEDIDVDTGEQIVTAIAASESFGSINLRISIDKCNDGTPWGQCSVSTPGLFCDNGDETIALDGMIDCAGPTGCTPINWAATSCSCPAGQVDDGFGVCVSQSCVPGECLGTNADICDPTCSTPSCDVIQDCYSCGQSGQNQGTPLGWLDEFSNSAECPLAYDGVTPAERCLQTQGTCKYKGKSGKVNINLQGN